MDSEHYIAYHGFTHLQGASDSHRFGLRIQIRLEDEKDYKEFKSFRKHRKGKAGSGLYHCYLKSESESEWSGPLDLRFINWSLTSSKGAVVTFEMDDYDEWRHMRDNAALDEGYEVEQLGRIEFILVELDEEGKPINVKKRARLERARLKRKWGKGGPRSKHAARLCQNDRFLWWLTMQVKAGELAAAEPGGFTEALGPAEAAEWMRKTCEIDTRAQLDHDPAALERFEQRVQRPFLRYEADLM